MTGIQDKRRAIRHLLREDDPADAMAAYYALYHPDDKTTLVVPPTTEGQRANGYVALSRTGIDLFRPLVTMRLPTDRLGYKVEITDEAKRTLAAIGYQRKYGVRALRRTLLERIEEPLSGLIIDGKLHSGERVIVEPDGEKEVILRVA